MLMKLPLHIPEPLEGIDLVAWFAPKWEGALFRTIGWPVFFEQDVERVPVDRAKAILLQNNFRLMTPESVAYIKKYADLAEQHGILVYIFCFGDFTDNLYFDPRVKVFRLSVYRSELTSKDIVTPTFTEDHGRESVVVRHKIELPRVSFCGMGSFPSWKGWVKYFLKNILWDLRALGNPHVRAKKIGVYWRRAMMHACEKSPLLTTHFIIRRTFSGLKRTIEVDPKVARKEYLDSIIESDFILAPKGDGNYSNRFLKTLSLGRIPVVADTDIVLPLEDVIDYSKIMVRVPMNEVQNTAQYIRAFYDTLTDEEWQDRQRMARKAFEDYLRTDSFFRYFFSTIA